MSSNSDTASGTVKRLIVNKRHDLSAFTSSDTSRHSLRQLHYHPGRGVLEACDGHLLIQVPVEKTDEFPPVPTLDHLPEANGAQCLIPAKPFLKALANIPKSNLPILENARLDIEAGSAKDLAAKWHLTTTDLDTLSTISGKSDESTYPNTDSVWPTKEPTLTIAFAADVLLRLGQYASKHASSINGTTAVVLQLRDAESPATFRISLENGQEAKGVAMPVGFTETEVA